ncbi:MAG TPA: phosphotransferase [Pseudonocardiaceae bacterium]|nr:phosphotransferase [Pseudonocardiaceae bacterium]
MVRRTGGGTWEVTGVLDWEFAMSGHRMIDVGNMRRFALDLFALADPRDNGSCGHTAEETR